MTADDPESALYQCSLRVEACTRCSLCNERTHTVFARGVAGAALMIVGEAPGAEEDKTGLPFVGKSGELLGKMIDGMQIPETEVYICNTVKCRPPGNRTPTTEEIEACSEYLHAQIELVGPKVILAMGRTAMIGLGMGFKERWRGRWKMIDGRPVIATYHPAYVLRNPEAAKAVGLDLRQVANEVRKRMG